MSFALQELPPGFSIVEELQRGRPHAVSFGAADLVDRFAPVTGERLSRPPASSRLRQIWQEAPNTEAARERIPRRFAEQLETAGHLASAADLDLLAETMTGPVRDAVAAVRVLAVLGEEGLAPLGNVRRLLLDFLEHRHPGVRLAAVEAFWQMADTVVKTDLEAALLRESHEEVRATLRYVLHLFG